jgi:hypothetical protein
MNNTDSGRKIAGPLEIDESVMQLDASIREDNDGERIDDAAVREYVANHQTEIFGSQTEFFAELRSKAEKSKT